MSDTLKMFNASDQEMYGQACDQIYSHLHPLSGECQLMGAFLERFKALSGIQVKGSDGTSDYTRELASAWMSSDNGLKDVSDESLMIAVSSKIWGPLKEGDPRYAVISALIFRFNHLLSLSQNSTSKKGFDEKG